jgi:hypothetical protein
VLRSLVDMGIMLVNGQWLDSFLRCARQKASGMTAANLSELLAALATFGYKPDEACMAALMAQVGVALTCPMTLRAPPRRPVLPFAAAVSHIDSQWCIRP